jgi:hypothetical protein
MLPATQDRIDAAVDRLLREMLFSGEAPLDGPARGTSNFAEEFAARGPVDRRGRSLRDFDLEERLFRYPLSFLVYSAAFDALPELVKHRFYDRLDAILTAQDQGDDFTHLDASARAAIREILDDTKPEFRRRR